MASRSLPLHAVARPVILAGLVALAAGLWVSPHACAQVEGPPAAGTPLPFTDVQAGMFGSREMGLRLMYESPSYGLDGGEFGIGVESRRMTDRGALLFSAQYDLNFASARAMGVDIGGGYRWVQNIDIFRGSRPRILGVSLWYDGTKTELENYFNQVGVTFESLGELWDFRFNANVPVGDTTLQSEGVLTNDLGYSENFLTRLTLVPTDHAVTVIDFEVARRLLDRDAWIFGGGYGLETTGRREFGGKGGVRGFLSKDLMLQLEATHDEIYKTMVSFSVIWYPGRCGRCEDPCPSINDRLLEPVIRHNYVATNRTIEEGNVPLTDQNGHLVRIVHVDSNAGGAGDGTFEHPFTNLDVVFDGSINGDIILVHADSTYNNQSIVLHDLQRLLGEGGGVEHTVVTTELGSVTLPETFPGALHADIPVIEDAPGAAVTLGNAGTTHSQDAAVSSNEVSNLSIVGGAQGIVSASHGIGDVNINHMRIADTTGNGIDLEPFVETISETSTKQVRFNPTIDQNTFENVGGDDIHLDATTTEPSSTTVIEDIQVTENTSTDGNGRSVNIINNKEVATISDHTYDGGTTGDGGLRFAQSEGGANVSTVSIENGTGPGIDIDDSSEGTFTFTGTTVTDTGGAGFRLNGGTAAVNFSGKITQGANAAAVSVAGGHNTGAVTFSEQITGEGVIDATNGTGLVFNNAQSSYSFLDAVRLHGGNAGVDIETSSGLFTFDDTTIENPGADAFTVNGSTAVVDFTGKITQDANDGVAAVNIHGGHTGTVTFDEVTADQGVVEASTGTGLQFANADGTYTFNDGVSVTGSAGAGATEGINITEEGGEGSDGVFTFSEATLTDIDGTAFHLNGGTAAVNFTGKITQDANDGVALVSVEGNHHASAVAGSGTATFTEFTANAGVVEASMGTGLQFSDADGTYTFNSETAISGIAGDGSTAGINITDGSDGTFTFSRATFTDINGDAFRLNGGTAIVNFTGRITQDANDAVALVKIEGGHRASASPGSGVVNFTESPIGAGVIEATMGTGLQFANADGTYNFNSEVAITGVADAGSTAGINIDSQGGEGSDGTFTFTRALVTDIDGVGFNLNGGLATVTLTGKITQTANDEAAVSVSGGHSSGIATFNEATPGAGVVEASDGSGIVFDDADGTYRFNDAVTLSGTAVVNITGDSSGTINFNDTASEITNSTGTAFTVAQSAATVTYAGTITSHGTGRPVEITANTGGTVTLSGEITSDGDGISVDNNSGGTFNLSNTNSEIANTSGVGLIFEANSNGVTMTYNGKIATTGTGTAVEIFDNTGGTANLTGEITSSADGIYVHDNTGGTFHFDGLVDLDTGANHAIELENNNTAATTTFVNLDLTTTTGTGLKTWANAGTSGGTLQITGSNNTIVSTGGRAVDMSDTTISASGVAFKSISADGGDYGIVLNGILGGSFTVGASGASAGDGGTIQNTSVAGISITNTAVASLNNMLIQTTTGGSDGVSLVHNDGQSYNVTIANSSITGATGAGIDLAISGTGSTRVNFNNNSIDNTTDQGIVIAISGDSPSTSNITLDTNNVVNSSNDEAMLLSVTGTGVKTVNFLAEDNHFSNNSPAASAFDIQGSGAVTLNTTVRNNVFVNGDGAGTGRAYETSATDGAANVRLSLLDNTATASASQPFLLTRTAGSFSIVNLTTVGADNVDQRNGGAGEYATYPVGWVIELNPDKTAFSNDAGGIPTP